MIDNAQQTLTISLTHCFWLWRKWGWQSVQCHTGLNAIFNFLTSGHSGAQSAQMSNGVECSQEGDRIPSLKSNRQALEQEHCLSWVLRHCSDASTDFLDQLYGRLVPGTGSFNCHWWQKDVRGRQRAILDNLVLCCLVCCWACFSGFSDLCVTSHAMGLPRAQGSNVVPSGRVLLLLKRNCRVSVRAVYQVDVRAA